MFVEELDIVDRGFELNDLYNVIEVNQVPIMDTYPDPKNTFELDLQKFSNNEGGFDVSGDDIAGAVQGVGNIVQAFQKTGIKKVIKDTCGRRPITKKKRESSGWNACETRVKQLAQGTHPSQQPRPQDQQQFNTPPPPPRGMSTGAKVGIGLGIVAVLGIVGFVIYKKRQG